MAFLQHIIDFISAHMGATGIIAAVLEAGMRLIKTDKPMSLLLALAGLIHLAGDFVKKIGEVIGAVSGFLDKIVPQKLK